VKRFACCDIIPGCSEVFTGADDQSVLDQVIVHAAEDHGLVKPPLALVELVVATTHSFTPVRPRGHLRLVGAKPAAADCHQPSGDQPGGAVQEGQQLIGGIPGQPVREDRQLPHNGRAPLAAVSHAGHRFAGRAGGADAHADPDAAVEQSVAHVSYRHECLFYRGTDELVNVLLPFVKAGLALDQPVMVALAEPRLRALRIALGQDAERVVLADMADLGHNPASIIPAWRAFTNAAAGRPSRGVGEPIWAGRRAAEIAESQLHEALLDTAIGSSVPLWLLCPYDVDALDAAVIAEAHRSHALVVESVGRAGSSAYGGSNHVMDLFAAALPEPVAPTTVLAFDAERHGEFAAEILGHAAAAGLPAQRSARLAAAVDEIAMTAVRAAGAVTVRLWQDEGALVCQLDDAGVIDDPMIGRSASAPPRSRERSIRLANELCDLVQVRSGAAGTVVRVHSWRRPGR
jgi:predicted small metal-binding protein/anti-sigma regulatory factor (Ser/Thr protein kinase)